MSCINLHTLAFYSALYHNRTMQPQAKVAYIHSLKGTYPTHHRDTAPMKRVLAWLASSSQHHIIPYDNDHYPIALREISSPPIILFCHGDISYLTRTSISIVGSRRASSYGIRVAKQFAKTLGHIDITVISGLATGIDTAVAEGALDTPGGTIAVLGNGTDITYPTANTVLQRRIAHQGLVISEFWPSTPPRSMHFPQRNRLISGLSTGTCVVEAALQSGSLITARYALEQNKALFAVPGSIYHHASSGVHWLIQQGAEVVQHPNDILRSIADYCQPQDYSLAQQIMWHLLQRPHTLEALQGSIAYPQHAIQQQLLCLAKLELIQYKPFHYSSINHYTA